MSFNLDLTRIAVMYADDEERDIRRRREHLESQLEQPVKGLSKGFVAYKKQLNNPDEAELKFHGFIHEAVKRREQQKIDLIKKK